MPEDRRRSGGVARRLGGAFPLAALLAVHAPSARAEGTAPSPAEAPPRDRGEEAVARDADAAVRLEDLVVVARPERDLIQSVALESPGLEPATTSIGWRDAEDRHSKSVIDAVEYAPGAWVESRGRKVKQFFSIRGQTYPYPEYAVDGAWQREFHEMPYLLSAAHFQGIEILRSGGGILMGPGSAVGYLNLLPRVFEEREFRVVASYGFYNTTEVDVVHGDTVGGVSYAFGFGHHSTDGPRGENAAENLADFYGRVSGSPVRSLTLSLDLFGLYGYRELERAEPPATTKLQDDRSRYDPYRAVLAVGKARLEESETAALEIALDYAHRNHDFFLASVADLAGVEQDEEDFEFGANAIQAVEAFRGNVVRFGALYNRWVAPEGKRFYVGRRCDVETISGVVADEQTLGPLILAAGYRGSATYLNDFGAFGSEGSSAGYETVVPVRDEWEEPVHTGTFGAKLAVLEELSLHANFTAGHVEPRAGTVTADLSEPETETRTIADIGFRLAIARAGEISVTGFAAHREDAIVLAGGTVEVDGRVLELYDNQDLDQLGLEIDSKTASVGPGLRLFANLLLMRSWKEAGGDRERDRAQPEAIAAAGVRFERGPFDAAVYLKYVSRYESVRFVPATLGPQPLGDYVNLDASAGWSFGGRKQHRVFVVAENLTDEEYATVAGYRDFGLRVSGGVRFVF